MSAALLLEAMGWLGSSLIVLSLLQRELGRLRLLNLVAALVLAVFNALMGIPSMVALNVVLVAVNAAYLIGSVRRPRRPDAIGPPEPATA